MTGKIDVGRVAREVFEIYRDQAAVLLPAAAAIFVIEAVLTGLLLTGGIILYLLALAVEVIALTFYTGMVVALVRDVQDGRRDSSIADLFKFVAPVVLTLLAVGFLRGIGTAIGFLLLIVPGVILLTIWAVAAPVVVLERSGVLRAFTRSLELVRGNFWPVLGAIVLFFLIVIVVNAILAAVGAAIGDVGRLVGSFIASVITVPLSALVSAVLYFNLTAVRNEVGTSAPPARSEPGAPPAESGPAAPPASS